MSERKTTRFAVLEAERVVKVHEREIPALKADEVFLTNAIIEIQPVHHYKKAVFNTAVSTKIKNLLKTS